MDHTLSIYIWRYKPVPLTGKYATLEKIIPSHTLETTPRYIICNGETFIIGHPGQKDEETFWQEMINNSKRILKAKNISHYTIFNGQKPKNMLQYGENLPISDEKIKKIQKNLDSILQ